MLTTGTGSRGRACGNERDPHSEGHRDVTQRREAPVGVPVPPNTLQHQRAVVWPAEPRGKVRGRGWGQASPGPTAARAGEASSSQTHLARTTMIRHARCTACMRNCVREPRGESGPNLDACDVGCSARQRSPDQTLNGVGTLAGPHEAPHVSRGAKLEGERLSRGLGNLARQCVKEG